MRVVAIVVAVLIAGIGCASAGKRDPEPKGADADEEGALVGGLPESAIPKGACGMVLWTLDEDRPTPIFRYVVGKEADMVLDGKPAKFALTEAAGASSFGVAETQKFTNEEGVTLTVETRFSLGFDGGSYLERGVISLVAASGWKTVVPTAGLAGCRAS